MKRLPHLVRRLLGLSTSPYRNHTKDLFKIKWHDGAYMYFHKGLDYGIREDKLRPRSFK